MKKIQRRLLSVLLACLLICVPFTQVFAETAYDASMGIEEQLLFPNDSLVSASGMVMLDGAEQPLAEGGTWINTDTEKVYSASSAEDGTIHLTFAGYVLVVEGGTAEYKKSEKEENANNHYEFLDWEMPLETDPTLDIACYESEAKVRLIADDPAEGMQFAGWVTDTEDFVIEDPMSMETVIVMPEKKVEVRAEYVPAAEDAGIGSDVPVEEQIEDVMEDIMEELPVEEIPQEEIPADEPIMEEIPQEESSDIAAEDVLEEVLEEIPEESIPEEIPTDVLMEEIPADAVLEDVTVDIMADLPTEEDITDNSMSSGEVEVGEPATFTVTVNDGMGEGSYTPGSWVTVTAYDRTEEGFAFTGWFVDSMNASLDDASAVTAGFMMPEADVILTATYMEIPETEAPETEAPETEAPETEAPQTEAPETEAPETEAPQTEAPETEAPQTEAPQTEAPETEAPQTEAPFEDFEPSVTYNVTVTNGVTGGAYEPGAQVGIEANDRSAEGLVFTSWKVTPETVVLENPAASITTFTMPESDVTVEAQYAEKTYNVTLVDAVFADGTTDKSFKAGETVTVNAVTPNGTRFTGWAVMNASDYSDAGISLGESPAAQISFTMPAKDLMIAQNYENLPNTYTVTVSNGLINGTASSMTVEEGTIIDVKANPGPTGQAFAYWRINDGSFDMGEATYSETIRLTVTQNLNILAVYEGIEYKVSVKNGYSDYSTCASGSVVTITANPAPEGKVFDRWKVKSGNVSLTDAYSASTTFTMPQGDVSVVAKYKQVTYSVTVENGSSDKDTYHAGDTVTITSNYPASGREFSKWAAVSGNVTFEAAGRWKTTFVMPAANVTVRATYEDGPAAANNAIQELIAGGEYLAGSTIKFTAYGAGMDNTNPNPGDYRYRPSGYQISNVTGTWQAAPYTTSMTIKSAGEYTLKVIFNKDVYDGEHWVSEGTSDAKSAVFYVVTEAEGVNTGDDTPLVMMIAAAAASCLIFIVLLIVFLKRRRR